MEGIFIPMEFYKIKEIKGLERDVLAIYKYYTENGNYKCCSLSNIQIADELNISKWYIKKIKKHLKDLGYIKTDGGVKVFYLGIQGCTTVPSGGVPQYPGGVPQYPNGCTTVPSNGEPQYTHKKEKEKEKKEFKEEGKKATSNFELLFAALSEEDNTPEKRKYIEDTIITGELLERFNSLDMTDSDVRKKWVDGIHISLYKNFKEAYYQPPKKELKEEQVSDPDELIQ